MGMGIRMDRRQPGSPECCFGRRVEPGFPTSFPIVGRVSGRPILRPAARRAGAIAGHAIPHRRSKMLLKRMPHFGKRNWRSNNDKMRWPEKIGVAMIITIMIVIMRVIWMEAVPPAMDDMEMRTMTIPMIPKMILMMMMEMSWRRCANERNNIKRS